MSKIDDLKSMLNNLINDKLEEASLHLHNYMTYKMKEVVGLSEAALSEEEVDEILASVTEEELEEAVRAGWFHNLDINTNKLVRPKNQMERDLLATVIKNSRNEKRADAASDMKKELKNLSRGADETAGAFMQRKKDLIASRKVNGAQSARQGSRGVRGYEVAAGASHSADDTENGPWKTGQGPKA
jgi:hypothetical protein